jgi:hypothetical protein
MERLLQIVSLPPNLLGPYVDLSLLIEIAHNQDTYMLEVLRQQNNVSEADMAILYQKVIDLYSKKEKKKKDKKKKKGEEEKVIEIDDDKEMV